MKTWHGRLEAFLDFLLTRRGQARQRSAVKRIEGGDDFVAAFVVTELARQLEQSFVRLRAAVAEKQFARSEQIDQGFGQAPLRLRVIKIRNMNDFARLFQQRLGDGRVRVAETAHRNAAAQVEIAPTGHVVKVASGPVTQRQFKPRIAWDDVFLEQCLNRGDVIADNGGRGRDYLFHLKFGIGLREQAREDNEFLPPPVWR